MMKHEACDTGRLHAQFMLKSARPEHCHDICNLVNLTYRGNTGWTRETHIIGGNRTNLDEITTTSAKPGGQFYVTHLEQQLTTCIYLAKEQDHAYIGFFSVHPDFQNMGIGKHILSQTETIAKKQLAVDKIRMFVVSQRPELIAFYQRRGYQRTGNREAYPLQLKIGVPKVSGLTIEYLEKLI